MPKKGTIEEIKAYKRENYLKNKEKNREKRKLYSKLYKEANKERTKKVARLYYLKKKEEGTLYHQLNRKLVSEKQKKYWIINPTKMRERSSLYQRRRRKDPLYKFRDNIRTRVRNSFTHGFTKRSKSFEILGCNYETFRSYIESKFEPWMSWENYGNWNGYPKEPNISWDLDHIIPVSEASSEEEIVILNHYTNFQPLCSYVNRYIKSAN